MAGGQPRVLPSLLDRLVSGPGGGGSAGGQSVEEVKESIRRDLQDLLNTRWRCLSPPAGMEELAVSLVNYGLPDSSGLSMGSPEAREAFRREVEEAVRRFEPRLRDARVQLVLPPGDSEPLDRTLRFRIEAALQADPFPEDVTYDSTLQPLTASFEVEEGGR